jgi:Resolvase, N terminal domain
MSHVNVKETSVLFTAPLVSQLDPQKSNSIRCDGFLYSRSKGGGKMRIGYARVSTTEQNLDLQRDALKRAGCEKIIEDTASGANLHRSGLERVQEMLGSGDVLAVWRLDRRGILVAPVCRSVVDAGTGLCPFGLRPRLSHCLGR